MIVGVARGAVSVGGVDGSGGGGGSGDGNLIGGG